MNPVVTIVVPTRGDRPDYLAECISSIRAQDVPLRLTLVTDDDATADRLRREAVGADVVVQPGNGAAAAIDHVLRRADTPFCAWLGDDDMLVPGSMQESVKRLTQEPRATGVFGRCEVIDAHGAVVGSIPTGWWAPTFSRFGRDLIPQPGSVLRTAAYQAVGGLDNALRYAFDLDLFLKLAAAGKLEFTPHILARFRWHEMSLTATNPAPQEEARWVRRRHLPAPLRATEGLWSPIADVASRAIYAVNRRRNVTRT